MGHIETQKGAFAFSNANRFGQSNPVNYSQQYAAPSADAAKKVNGKLVLIIVLLVILAAVAVVFVLLSNNKNGTGTINTSEANRLAIIFDESAPVPYMTNNKYGFIDPNDGHTLIDAQYAYVDRFYGDYAIVYSTVNNNAISAIINRKGEKVQVQQDPYNGQARYYDDENVWAINGNVYNSKMTKINPEGTSAVYISNGLFRATDVVVNENNTTNDGESTLPDVSLGNSKIYDINTSIIYDCQKYCSALSYKDDSGNKYIVIKKDGESSTIINMNGEIIYRSSSNRQLIMDGNGVITDYEGDNIKYIQLNNGSAEVINNYVKTGYNGEQILSEGFSAKICDNDKYSITNGEKNIFECDVYSFTELDKDVASYYEKNNGKKPLFIENSNGLALYDLKTKNTIADFSSYQNVTVFEGSPFVVFDNYNDATFSVCNIVKNSSCLTVKNDRVIMGYSNYVNIYDGSQTKIYNSSMKELK